MVTFSELQKFPTGFFPPKLSPTGCCGWKHMLQHPGGPLSQCCQYRAGERASSAVDNFVSTGRTYELWEQPCPMETNSSFRESVHLVQALIKWLSQSYSSFLEYLLVVVSCLKRKGKIKYLPKWLSTWGQEALGRECAGGLLSTACCFFLCVVHRQHIPWTGGLKIYLTEFSICGTACSEVHHKVILLQDWHKGMSHLIPTDW